MTDRRVNEVTDEDGENRDGRNQNACECTLDELLPPGHQNEGQGGTGQAQPESDDFWRHAQLMPATAQIQDSDQQYHQSHGGADQRDFHRRRTSQRQLCKHESTSPHQGEGGKHRPFAEVHLRFSGAICG